MIGDELRKQRKFKELFRKDIAEKTGMHQQTIRNIENGTGLMSTVEKYAEAMGLEIVLKKIDGK
jgi:transcriptional regulator with XRE-family HTH domain